MTPRKQENGTMNAAHDTTKFPKDWLLSLVKRHSSENTQKSPPDLRDEKILAVAPMVDQSDLPFRLLCRKYGSNIAWTPMIHSKLFVTRESYQQQFFNLVEGTPLSDRPLIAQLCGSEEEYVIKTAQLLQPHVDGIDLNCGCPQGVSSMILVCDCSKAICKCSMNDTHSHYSLIRLHDEETMEHSCWNNPID